MEERKYAVLLHTNGDIKPIKIDPQDKMHEFYKAIGCRLIQSVKTYLGSEYDMIVDEEGLLKEKLYLNFNASYWYGFQNHGSPIVGNALIVKDGYDDFELMTKQEATDIAEEVRSKVFTAFDKVTDAYERLKG